MHTGFTAHLAAADDNKTISNTLRCEEAVACPDYIGTLHTGNSGNQRNGTNGTDDAVKVLRLNILRRCLIAQMYCDIGVLLHMRDQIVFIGPQVILKRHKVGVIELPAQHRLLFKQGDPMAALGGQKCSFHSAGTTADDGHALFRVFLWNQHVQLRFPPGNGIDGARSNSGSF